MANAYNNQAHNVPPAQSGLAVGMKVETKFGTGTITEIVGHFQGYDNVNTPLGQGVIATILVPGNPPIIFRQALNAVVFSSNVGGESSITDQFDNNL